MVWRASEPSAPWGARLRIALLSVAALAVGAPAGPARAGSAAAPMHFAHLGGDSGLSPGGVMAILQDRQGFLWLGTEDGLDRYDGYELRHHVHDPTHRGSVPNNWVSALAEDAAGTLWIGTDGGGVVGLNSGSGSFNALPIIDARQSLGSQEKVRVLRFDRKGVLWIGTRDAGLFMVDRARNVVRHFRHSTDDTATLSSDSVFAVIEDASGAIWVGTGGGLDRLDPASGQVQRQTAWLAMLPGRSRSDVAVNALLEDRHGDLWIATDAGLIRRTAASGTFSGFRNRPGDDTSLPGNEVQCMLEDHAGRLWIGTTTGLALYDPDGGFAVYRHNPIDTATLPDDNVISLFEDRGGLLWVGTKSGGVAKWNSRSWSFGHHDGAQTDSLGDSNVAAFAEDPAGVVWIANLGAGLDAVDRIHGTTRHYRHQAGDPSSLPDDRVTALLFDRQGTLWVGTMTAGLSRFDRQMHRLATYRNDPNDAGSLGAAGVMSMLEDSNGRIWVGTYGGGLSLLDVAKGRFTRYTMDTGNPATLSSDRATALAEDPSGRIWVGTDGGGLCLLEPLSGQVTRFAHDPRNPQSLSANTVYAIRADQRGRIWVGTRGGGLDEVLGSTLDPAAITFRNFSESEGLPNTTIYGIETSARGRLWLSTNRGLSRFDARSHEVRNFRSAHGLQGDEFNFGAHYRAADGELFFGGPHGYNAFYPERLQFDEVPPPIVLTAFLKFNEPAPTVVPHEHLRSIDLGHRDDIVTFEFAALDFASPEDNSYRYMLEGFDKGWVEAGAKHTVTYTNLAGGDYTFRVRAANSDGKWNDAGLVIPIKVQPPRWATPWAYVAYVAALALVLFAVWNSQHKKLRREARYAHRLEQDVRDRTAELAQRNEELESVNRQLQEASVTDPLTGLGNRRYLRDALAGLTKSAASPAAGQPAAVAPAVNPTIALLIVDLDHLKPVNDVHGHEAGDQILLQVAEILRRCCRASDFIARWGGDEFVIAYRDEDLGAAEVLAERIRSRVAKQIFRFADGKVARTSCSIGFSRYPFVHEAPDLLTWEQCLAVADAALYHAKKERNGWIGWAGTAAAIEIPSIVKLLERNPDALERDGRLEVHRPRFRPDDTVDDLRPRNRRRGD
jgi:diguanylate cyclase (GGDEF)-like protein